MPSFFYYQGGIDMVKKSIESLILDTLIDLADSGGHVYMTKNKLAKHMGYKRSGGALTLGIKLLSAQGKVAIISKNHYKVLV